MTPYVHKYFIDKRRGMLHRFLTSRREVTLIKAWWCLVFRACNTNKMPWIIFSQFLTLQVTVNLLNILKIYPHMMFNGNLTLNLQIGPHLWRSSFVSFIFLLSFYFFTIASCQRLYFFLVVLLPMFFLVNCFSKMKKSMI